MRKCGVQDPERTEQDKQWKYNCGLQKKIILASSWTYLVGPDENTPLAGRKGAQESWPVVKDSLLKAREWFIPMHKRSCRCGKRTAWINAKLLTGLKHNKEIHRRWARGRQAWKENQRRCWYIQERSQEGQSSAGVEASRAGDRQQDGVL